MDAHYLDNFGQCMACSNDIETIELYFSDPDFVVEEDMILNGDQATLFHSLDNLPSFMIPTTVDVSGIIRCRRNETSEEINSRKIKMIVPQFEMGSEEEDDIIYLDVTLPMGSLAYQYIDDDTGERFVFTTSPLNFN